MEFIHQVLGEIKSKFQQQGSDLIVRYGSGIEVWENLMKEISSTRINKYLSEVGFCSRRAADKYIEEGRVTINGKVPEMGTKIIDGDEVRVDGELISPPKEDFIYIALNKPVGIVCTTDTKAEKNNITGFI